MRLFRKLAYMSLFVVVATSAAFVIRSRSFEGRAEKAATRVTPELRKALKEVQLQFGAPVFIRIFKESDELELWMAGSKGRFKLFRTYEICRWSGGLGPKLKEGDRQSPEGFYEVGPDRMNSRSRFHLAFNLGFPNEYDRTRGRTGSYLMVHGSCVSVGCYAMTDDRIEERRGSGDSLSGRPAPPEPPAGFPAVRPESATGHQRHSSTPPLAPAWHRPTSTRCTTRTARAGTPVASSPRQPSTAGSGMNEPAPCAFDYQNCPVDTIARGHPSASRGHPLNPFFAGIGGGV